MKTIELRLIVDYDDKKFYQRSVKRDIAYKLNTLSAGIFIRDIARVSAGKRMREEEDFAREP